jgi:hypothetical protein
MDQAGCGKGKLVPTGKGGPVVNVSYQISQHPVEIVSANGAFLRQKAIVHSIADETGQLIALGDFDLLVGNEILRLKHIAKEPEWLVLSSNASAVCS